MGDAKIYRYEVPVDDVWHAIKLSGPVVHVDARKPDVVEFWALDTNAPRELRGFRVFGTGQPLPGNVKHVGTALVGPLVWHLMEDEEIWERPSDG